MFCHKCGNKIAEDAGFCHNCGTKVIQGDITQEPLNMLPTNVESQSTSTAEPLPQTSATPVQTFDRDNFSTDSRNDFKAFVDNHVRTTTKFQSADDLLKNSKPWTFLWICLGVSFIIGTVLVFPIGGLVFLIFGYAAAFIASGIIRLRYNGAHSGEFTGDIDINDLFVFLNEHLKHIHPDFHEWGYLTKKGLLPLLENAIANATEEVRICSEFGPNRKHLAAFYIKPKTVDAKPGEKLYFVDALKNGFLVDGRAAGFLGHGTLIRTAPILQAAMEYYLKIYKLEGDGNNVLSQVRNQSSR